MRLDAEKSDTMYCLSAQAAVSLADYLAFNARFSHVDADLTAFSQEEALKDQMQTLKSQMAAVHDDTSRPLSVILEALKQKLGRLLESAFEELHKKITIAGHGTDHLVAVEIGV